MPPKKRKSKKEPRKKVVEKEIDTKAELKAKLKEKLRMAKLSRTSQNARDNMRDKLEDKLEDTNNKKEQGKLKKEIDLLDNIEEQQYNKINDDYAEYSCNTAFDGSFERNDG